MITTEKAVELCNAAMNRDPRKFPYGYFSGGSAGLDTARVFMWFASVADLINHIIECEPPVYELDSDEASLFAQNVAQIFSDNSELSVEKLVSLNTVAKSFLCVEWWGTFDDLTSKSSDFAKTLRLTLRDDESDSAIRDTEIDDFIELIKNYGF